MRLQQRRRGHWQTGDCGGLFQCKGWGTIPATLAEVNFDAWDNLECATRCYGIERG
jgi:hypothetical protein